MLIVPQIQKVKKVPFNPKQMFDLVMDIEKYPLFLPWCVGSKIISQNDLEVVGQLTVAKAGLQKSFTTRNRLFSPEKIEISLVDGPFKRLDGVWQFVQQSDGCLVKYQMQFEIVFLLAPVFSGVMDMMSNSMVDSFVNRAHQLY